MKKLACFAASLLTVFTFVSCSNDSADEASDVISVGTTRSLDTVDYTVGSESATIYVESNGEHSKFVSVRLTMPRTVTFKGRVQKGFNQWGEIAAHSGTKVNLINLSTGTVTTLDMTEGLTADYTGEYYWRSKPMTLLPADYILQAQFTSELGVQWAADGKHGSTSAYLEF